MKDYSKAQLSSASLARSYLTRSDWQVKQDANKPFSFPGFMEYLAEEVTKNFAITSVLSPEAAKAHNDGDIYIHDLGKHIVPYCAGWDIRKLLMVGFTGVPDKCSAGPAKHLQTALDHVSRFILIVCNEWSGAQAFTSVDTFLAPFIFYDKLSYKEIKSSLQSFIYNLGISTRYGGQTPFSNITLDWTIPDDVKTDPVIIGGILQKKVYGDFQKEVDLFNRALIEVFMEGDSTDQPFSFPIPTYNLTKDFNWDSPNADLLFEMTAKYGNPYFQNFINSHLKPGDVRAMCCRLQMDMTQLIKITGGRWASGASTGSIGVVEINLPRIGYLSKGSEVTFFDRLDKLLLISRNILEQKRELITKYMEEGLTPYTKYYLGSFQHHFSTIAIVGMNEALRNMWNLTTADAKGIAFTKTMLDHIQAKMIEFQKETKHLYNLEATPAESSSYKLAKADREKYPGIITAGNGEPYYTNSTQLPVGYTDDVFEALDLQDSIQATYSGGTVFHVFLGEKLASGAECKALVKKIASTYTLPYFSITPTFSICPTHGYIKGEAQRCPHLGKEGKDCTESPLVYSRIVGYYRPVQQWNKGKTQEFKERKEFSGCTDNKPRRHH